MKRNQKNEVKQGYYLDLTNGEFMHLDGTNALLTPYVKGKLVRVPAAAVIFGAPVIGLAYVMFLPLAAIAGVFAYLGHKIRGMAMALRHPAHENAEG